MYMTMIGIWLIMYISVYYLTFLQISNISRCLFCYRQIISLSAASAISSGVHWYAAQEGKPEGCYRALTLQTAADQLSACPQSLHSIFGRPQGQFFTVNKPHCVGYMQYNITPLLLFYKWSDFAEGSDDLHISLDFYRRDYMIQDISLLS